MDKHYTKKNELQNILKNLTLLYIEDEINIQKSLESTLLLIFKNVISVGNGENGLEIFREKKIDIILSDISLPGISGIEFSKTIRESNANIPIILLSAFTQKEFLLEATKLKLINYLTKPIKFDELHETFLSAAKDIVRNGKYKVYFEDEIYFDIINNLLYHDTKEIDLSKNERKLLNLFINNQNRTLKIEEIKHTIWEDDEKATQNALKSLLNKLRKKIGQNSIKNVSGIGYHLVTQ